MLLISDLPSDLEAEILSRVPSKSLAKLKTTCKRWYRLFRDWRFVEKNKKLGKAVRESILLSDTRVYSICDDLHGLHKSSVDPTIEFTSKLRGVEDLKDVRISQLYQCDGLVLLCSTEGKNKLVVWNPCTGQKESIKPRTWYWSDDIYYLGYVNVNRKNSYSRRHYKILSCCPCEDYKKVWDFEIYEFRTDAWRVLDDLTHHDYTVFCNGISLKGDTYFVAGDKETVFFLMKFDFTTERFVRLPLPFHVSDLEDNKAVLSVVKDEKLSVLHHDIQAWPNVMRIWVSNKIDEEAKDFSWSCDFVLAVDFDKFDVPGVANLASFLLDEENKVALCCDLGELVEREVRARIYIVGEDMYRRVNNDTIKAYHGSWPLVLTYVPSLVHIHKKTTNSKA